MPHYALSSAGIRAISADAISNFDLSISRFPPVMMQDGNEIKSAAAQFISRSGGYDVPAAPFLSDPVEHFLHDILHQHDRLQIRKQVEFGFEQRQNGFQVLRRRTAAAVPQF